MTDYTRDERLYIRAIDILDRKANGHRMPILEHLALRAVSYAMVALANEYMKPGRLADSMSPSGLYRGAWRRGDPMGASNLAIDCFNRGDLKGYRTWLHRAARAGDPYAARELKRFETRLPYRDAKKIRRGRPYRKYDSEIIA